MKRSQHTVYFQIGGRLNPIHLEAACLGDAIAIATERTGHSCNCIYRIDFVEDGEPVVLTGAALDIYIGGEP